MSAKPAVTTVTVERLRLSRAPAADLAGAAMQAQQAAGLARADFIIIAVDPADANVDELAARAGVAVGAQP